MNSELTIPEGNKKTLAELVGVSVDTSSSTSGPKKSTLARLKVISKALMGVKNIEGKEIKLEVLPAGAYELNVEGVSKGTCVYCVNPVVRFFSQREQWQRFDTENTRMDQSIMAESVYGGNLRMDLEDSTGTFNLGRPGIFDDNWDNQTEAYKATIRLIARHKLFFGTIDFQGKALDEDGNLVNGYDTPVPFILDVKNRTSRENIESFWDEVKEFTADELKISKNKDARKKAMQLGKFKEKFAENLMRHRVTLGSELFDTGFTWAAITIEGKVSNDLIDGDIENLIAFDEWIEWKNNSIHNLWKENNVEQLNGTDAELVQDFVDVE